MNNKCEHFGRVGVLMGGVSSERAISLKSGQAVFHALKNQGCDALSLDITEGSKDVIAALLRNAEIDLAFICLHGRLGEDGVIQSALDKENIPYTGSGAKASRLAFNKAETQNLLKGNNIRVPSFHVISKENPVDLTLMADELSRGPLIVKPSGEGSSIGITIVSDCDQLTEALSVAKEFDDVVLVERYIQGRELTVGILGQKALPVVEIIPQGRFFTYDAKYTKGATQYVVPADITGQCTEELQQSALSVHQMTGCVDLSRVDFMLDSDGLSYVLEINTIPGFTQTSLLPKAAACTGLNFDQLCLRLLECAHGKKEKIKNTTIR